ncbi:hypothetical protein HRbin39_00587 [bacterium HR39]|nr:hypothetical protein HRbin39_00587 [bacterium HR39]
MEDARIPVDSEVLVELTRRLRSPDQSFNDLLREWLGLPPRPRRSATPSPAGVARESDPRTGTVSTRVTLETPDDGEPEESGGSLESEESNESADAPGEVPLPEGTELRGRFHGREVRGRIEGGAVVLEGRRFTSLSAAARSVTGHPVNGWRFFEARLPGRDDWLPAARLRPVRVPHR